MRTEVEFTHRTFVLRIWRETADTAWRFTLQGRQPAEKWHFANEEALLAYLRQILPASPPSANGIKPIVQVIGR